MGVEQLRRLMDTNPVAFLRQSPRSQPATFLDLAGRLQPALAETLRERLRGIEHAEELARTPVIGVCGTVNSGKSTLVASFLSEQNRPRVLIGDYGDQATQRFVFWLPESLRHDTVAERCFDQTFEAQFGSRAERLDTEPDAAARQYNAKDRGGLDLGIPLVAYDPALDEHRLCFLDCPDVQRPMDEESLELTSLLRLDALVKATRLCSAFLLVVSQEQLPTKTTRTLLTRLRDHAPGLPIYLVLNKGSRDASADVANAEATLQDWGLQDLVLAVYQAPYQQQVHERSSWPAFTTPEGRSLSQLPASLDITELGHAYVQSGITEFRNTLDQTIGAIEENARRIETEACEVQNHVLNFLAGEFLDAKGNMRTLYSEGVSKAILQSMERTAPWEIRLAFTLNKPLSMLFDAGKQGLDGLREWLHSKNLPFGKSPEAFWKHPECIHEMNPEAFSTHLKPLRCVRTDVSKHDLNKIWQSALRALAEIDLPEQDLDAVNLDKHMENLWAQVPWYRRALTAMVLPTTTVLTVLAVLFVPIDFGIAAVKMASISELLGALGLSMLFNAATVTELTFFLESQVGLQQVSNLNAGLSDGLCLPRKESGTLYHRQSGRELTLPTPTVRELPPVTSVLDYPFIELDFNALNHIRESANDLHV